MNNHGFETTHSKATQHNTPEDRTLAASGTQTHDILLSRQCVSYHLASRATQLTYRLKLSYKCKANGLNR